MAWDWRTSPEGYLEVDRGAGFEVIALPGPDALTMRTETWLELARRKADQYDVPLSWVLGVIYSESGGDPTVSNFCCAGLMALALEVYHLTREQAFDPEINVDNGVRTLAQYNAKGWDLPATASMYNAGPARGGGPKSAISDPWGYVENRPAVPWTGYIEKVVRASNWWRKRELAGELGPPPIPPPSGPVLAKVGGASFGSALLAMCAGVWAGWEAWRRWWTKR